MILFIHPEGSFCLNPNFTALLELLHERGHTLGIIYPERDDLNQDDLSVPIVRHPIKLQSLMVDIYHSLFWDRILGRSEKAFYSSIADAFPEVDLLIGIDRGVIDAQLLSRHYQCPLVLLSYEQFFESETSVAFKSPEIEACKLIEMAIVQDPVRGANLASENQVPIGKLRYVPVAGRSIEFDSTEPDDLRKKLAIPEDRKIVLYTGSIQIPQAGIAEMLETLPHWPEEYVLLLNGLILNARKTLEATLVDQLIESGKLYFNEDTLSWDELPQLMRMADIGLAFYNYVEGDPHRGKNVKDIGLSAGKISTYLQYGLPYITHEIGAFAEIARSEELGWVLNTIAELPECLASIKPGKLEGISQRCIDYFNVHLSPDIYWSPVLDEWEHIMRRQPSSVKLLDQNDIQRYRESLESSLLGRSRDAFLKNLRGRKWLIRGTGQKGIQALNRLRSLELSPDGFVEPHPKADQLLGLPVFSTSESYAMHPQPFYTIASHLSQEIIVELKKKGLSALSDWHIVV